MKFLLTTFWIISLCVILAHSTSKYKGVSWHKKCKKWRAFLNIGKKYKDGGTYENELDAAKKVNQMCDKLQIKRNNPEVDASPYPNEREKTSQYKGVTWRKQREKWCVQLSLKGGKTKFGGHFKDELDAAKRVNQLCEQLGIPLQNLEVNATANQQHQQKTSKYKGVTWNKQCKKWRAFINIAKEFKDGGTYDDELEAAKKVNQMCDTFQIKRKNVDVDASPHPKIFFTSRYKGVSWHSQNRKWRVQLCLGTHKKIFGGQFVDELRAAEKVNDLCDKYGVEHKNLGLERNIHETNITKIKYSTSQYKGVSWSTYAKKWSACVFWKCAKYRGGYYVSELDAAQKVNQICDELGIERKNSGIGAMPNPKITYSTSQFKGVSWSTTAKKWLAAVYWKTKKYYGGYYKNEIDAAKRVNQLCDEFGKKRVNCEIDEKSNEEIKHEGTSQYNGVSWMQYRKQWKAYLQFKNKHKISYHINELNAARRVNQMCDEFGIKRKNLDIDATSNKDQDWKTLLNYDATQAEFDEFMKILDENEDPSARTIKENIFTAMHYGKETKKTEINFQTTNGESALSIAAKHGFSNVVKFLISKGANKEHFTHENHTPLSLAVYHNHSKLVEVLFEEWISPNSHEKPYLHLSPIFNVNNREIAQLLVDYDAVTNGLYNNKNQSPLTVACQNGFLDVVEFFLDDGLDINHLDSDNKTPLFYAFTNKHQDVVNFLISKGAYNQID